MSCVRGRGYRRATGQVDELALEAGVVGVATDLRAVHQTLDTLIRLMANQTGMEAQPHVEPIPLC